MSKTPWLVRAEKFLDRLRERIKKLDLPYTDEHEMIMTINDSWDLVQDNPALYGDMIKVEIEKVAMLVNQLEEKKGITLSKRERKRRNFGFADFFRGRDNDSIVSVLDDKIDAEKNGNVTQIVTETIYSAPSINKVEPDEFLVSVATGKNEIESKFEVYIRQEVYHKIMTLTKLLDDEITALLEVEREDEKFIIKGVQMFRQKVSKAQCEAEDNTSLVEMYQRMIKEGKNPAELKCWWHSHNSMGVSPSSTDYDTIKTYGVDYAIMLITNHSKDVHCQIHIFKPFEIKIKNVPVYVLQPGVSQKLIDECQEEINTYVKNEHRSYTKTTYIAESTKETPLSQTRELIKTGVPIGPYGFPDYSMGYDSFA